MARSPADNRRLRASWWSGAGLAMLAAFLVSPPFYYRLAGAEAGRALDAAFAWSIAMSVLWVLALHAFFRRPVALHVLLAPVYLLVAKDLFLIHHFGSRLTTSYLSIIITDHSEAGEFAHAYARPLVIGIALLAGTRGSAPGPSAGFASTGPDTPAGWPWACSSWATERRSSVRCEPTGCRHPGRFSTSPPTTTAARLARCPNSG